MTTCDCICHTNGAYPPPCPVPGGCGLNHDRDDEAHRCSRGDRCEVPETVTVEGVTVTVGAPANRPLCTICEQATTDALAAAPSLYVDLRNKTLDRSAGTAFTTRVMRSRSGSFGLNATPLHLTEGLHWHVTAWADEVIATAGRPAPDRASQPEGGQVDDACALLRRYLSVWVAHGPAEFAVTRTIADPDDPKAEPTEATVTVTQAGWEACAWLIGWRNSAERVLGVPLLVHYPPEPCPACNTPRALRRRDGDDKVSCTVCWKSWTLAMYETFVHAWVGGTAAPAPPEHRGPGAGADGQDARRGTAAHTLEAAS